MPHIICLIMIICAALPLLAQEQVPSDREYLNDFMRIRGDASGGETVYHWTGTVYSYVPDQKKQTLFRFEGFNIARTLPRENGFELLTREAAFFQDPRTGEILETWMNPFTGSEVAVQHIWNDPVNQDLTFDEEYLPLIRAILPSTDLGSQVCFNNDIFPFYPNPMPRGEYPEFSQSDNYQSAEFFQFFVNKSDLADSLQASVPASISWNRLSPWMPFMRMGDRQGMLVFSCRGRKLEGGFEALPERIRDYVNARKPEFAHAPEEYLTPNETSWTYFKKLVDAGLIKR